MSETDRKALADEVEQADVDAAMRTFEQLARSMLRYPESQGWHLRDKMAMREVLKQFSARRSALRADAGAEMRERCAKAADQKSDHSPDEHDLQYSAGWSDGCEATARTIRSLPLAPASEMGRGS